MVDRRAFLTGSVAIAATLAAWPARGAASVRRTSAAVANPSLVLVDRSLDTGAAFAAAAAADGHTVLTFGRDVAGLWMSAIEPRLRAGPVTIAGHTSAATLFCLDLLARDYGAHTVRRVDGDAAVTWVISSSPGRRAPLAPATVRALRSESHA